MTDRDRLKENIQILNAHNITHKPVLHLSNGQKYEFDVINEIVEDVSLILEKMENETLIELPCKVGSTLYKLCSVNSNIKIGQMWDGRIVKTNCDRCGYRNCSCYNIGLRELDKPYFINVIEEVTVHTLEFLVKIMPYVGTIFFTSKEEAEAKLKELKDNA